MSYSTSARISAPGGSFDVSSSSDATTASNNYFSLHHHPQSFSNLRQTTHDTVPESRSLPQHPATAPPISRDNTYRTRDSTQGPHSAHTSLPIQTYIEAWQSLPYTGHTPCMQDWNTEPSSSGVPSFSLPSTSFHQNSQDLTAASGSPWTGYSDRAMPQSSIEGIVATRSNDQIQQGQRAIDHRRTPSNSTVASATSTPSINYQQAVFPLIANTESSPQAAVFQANLASQQYSKSLQYNPSAYLGGIGDSLLSPDFAYQAHQAMQSLGVDYYHSDDLVPDFIHSSRHSMSSHGNGSPSTPPGADNSNDGVISTSVNNGSHGFLPSRAHSNLQLFRTESQAFQDELYNPTTESVTSTPISKPAPSYLSPHQTIMSERLQAANNIRSQSPYSGMSRERSPFRDHSPFAPNRDWRGPAGIATAAGMRQYQKEQAEKAELAQHMPKLRREPTKTISPKDALLDVHESDQPSLFTDTIPLGYKQHNTAADPWAASFSNNPSAALGPLQDPTVSMSFRPDVSVGAAVEGYNVGNMAQASGAFTQNQPVPSSFQAPSLQGSKSGQYLNHTDSTPHFPPTLTSMESSVSDNGPPSSAEDINLAAQRPADVRANTGTYTCTYHGCTQRFDTHLNLQKHKREVHRSQTQHLQVDRPMSPHESTTASSGAASPSESSPRSEVSPAPSGSGMSSAALSARNSQAGPHRCTRINPSTGKPCNTIFSRPYDLTRHEDTIHNVRKQKVRCLLCREEKTFSRNDALTRHMRVVHPDVEAHGRRGRH